MLSKKNKTNRLEMRPQPVRAAVVHKNDTVTLDGIAPINKNMKTTRERQGPDSLTAEERRELKNSDFGIPHSLEFPMPDAAHVRAAESYFRYASDRDKPLLAHRILLKARKFGVTVASSTIQDWARKYHK